MTEDDSELESIAGLLITTVEKYHKMRCKVCGRNDDDRPTIFRGLDYCSENCRKGMVREGSQEAGARKQKVGGTLSEKRLRPADTGFGGSFSD